MRFTQKSGLDCFFDQVEEAIILEDDVLPHPTLIPYCTKPLDHYRNESQIAMISGINFLYGQLAIPDSYYFSRYTFTLGWATWRHAWQDFDLDIPLWGNNPNRQEILAQFESRHERNFWRYRLNRVGPGMVRSWAIPWAFSCLARNQLCIQPARNLVSHIGVGGEATHVNERDCETIGRLNPWSFHFATQHKSNVMWKLTA